MKIKTLVVLTFISGIFFSCEKEKREGFDVQKWGNFWFQGKAEISAFDLKQYRYGEERSGEAVLIFVTEDFSRNKQVKLDYPEKAGRDKVSVIKMNQTREFVTGIYPYHLMLSVFTPIHENSKSLKLTSGVQEWCGQVFLQLNHQSGDSYKGKLFSYFEEEGDAEFKVSGLLEDELWNLIRIGPEFIPRGNVKLIPSIFQKRFDHSEVESEDAFIRVNQITANRDELEVKYASGNRTLKIEFENQFPYPIMAWEEIQKNPDGKEEVSYAQRKSQKVIDYWNRNKLEDEFLRKELKLGY